MVYTLESQLHMYLKQNLGELTREKLKWDTCGQERQARNQILACPKSESSEGLGSSGKVVESKRPTKWEKIGGVQQ